MPLFTYRARNEQGTLVKGRIEAEDQFDVARELGVQGYVPVRIRRSLGSGAKFSLKLGHRVKADDLILFTRQFHTIIRTGVPLVRGLQTLRDQSENEAMREVVSSLMEDIQKGNPLGEAMRKHPKVFSSIYCNTIRAGETSGRLEEILDRLAELLEYDQKVKEEIKSATRYPILVLIVMSLAIFVLMTFVVPKFTTLYARFDMELPLPTRILMGVSSYFQNYWYVNILAVVALIVGFRLVVRTARGRRAWDWLKLNVPVIGKITFKGIISRFSRMFATLTGSGVPILETLNIMRLAVGNTVIAGRIKEVRDKVMEGTGIAGPMSKTGKFPPLFVQMVSIGEETGALEDMLLEASRHYEREIDYHLKRLTAAIEPILIVCLGGMMLLLALAIFMPLWNLVGIVRR